MRIAVLAHVRHPIARPFMGGMEAHAWHLTRALMARGHDVTLFASGDSDAALPLAPICAAHYDRAFPWAESHGTDRLNAHLDAVHAAALARIAAGGFDVVHNNSLHRFPPRWARATRTPMVTSLHIPPFDVLERAMADSEAPWHLKTVTSAAHRASWRNAAPGTVRIVPNGIDLDRWPEGPGGGGFVWAGRIMANKGTGEAARAARRAGVPLTILGAVEDRVYFETQVAPCLGAGVDYGGHLGADDLARALGAASAFVFTPLWDEPFGLAAVEAMACGAPVAAFDNGAAREVVGEAGAFAPPGDVATLAQAMGAAAAIPRAVPAARARALYGLDGMVAGYEAAYADAVAACDAPAAAPAYREIELPAALTPPRRAGLGAAG